MCIGNFQHFEQSLHFAILAADTVQRVKANIGFGGGKLRIQLAGDVNLTDLIIERAQSLGAFRT